MQLAILQAASLKLGFGFGILGLQESNQTRLAHQMSTHIRYTQHLCLRKKLQVQDLATFFNKMNWKRGTTKIIDDAI